MDYFTDVYDKSRELLEAPCFDASWGAIERQVKALLGPDGPSDTEAKVLSDIRAALKDATKGMPQEARAVAGEIVRLARPDANGFQDRAALIKTLVHLHHVMRKGSQSIWVVDHPEAYGQWAYQEADGLSKDKLTTTLAHVTEAFGHSNRAIMSAALQLARKISMDVSIKLSNDDPRTRRKIGTWFLAPGASDAEIDTLRARLVDGFKQISALCNSNTVIFSDRPANRANPRFATAKASVNAGDFMPVIYIYRAFLRYGRRNDDGVRDQLWQCAKTIIHEMTHKLLDTADFRYANRGIRPGGALAVADAVDNADSWGIFALDVVGALPKDMARRAFK